MALHEYTVYVWMCVCVKVLYFDEQKALSNFQFSFPSKWLSISYTWWFRFWFNTYNVITRRRRQIFDPFSSETFLLASFLFNRKQSYFRRKAINYEEIVNLEPKLRKRDSI